VSVDSTNLRAVRSQLHFDDPINIQFTSGTTGRPKGATLTHHNILNNGYYVGNGIGLTPSDKVCIPVPLYHCFGMVMGNLACITHGSTMVYPAHIFDPIETLKTISSESCSILYGVPTMFLSQLDHPDFHRYNLSSLRSGITAGSICSGYLMKRLINEMNLKGITNCYGMTEVSPVCTQTRQDDSFEKKITSVGTVHPHVEIQIVKPGTRILPGIQKTEQSEEGEESNYLKFESVMTSGSESLAPTPTQVGEGGEGLVVPRGVTGELWVRGYSVMKGYWNDVKKTSESITSDGWMKTGDLASMTEDGYIVIEGRLKDMIIRGGENIYPKEIEEFLSHHPMIQDVQVVGLPDKKYGEELCAWIVLKQHQTQQVYHHVTEDDIRQYCRGKIAHYKIPRYIRFVDSFPLTITGKVRKIEIREKMIAELGLGEAGQDKKDSLA
jgi:fatty-acyl-CoA synthase